MNSSKDCGIDKLVRGGAPPDDKTTRSGGGCRAQEGME